MKDYEFWETTLYKGSKRATHDFFCALIRYDGRLHDSYVLGERKAFWACPNWYSVFMMISLPKENKEEFEKLLGKDIKMEIPKTVRLNRNET